MSPETEENVIDERKKKLAGFLSKRKSYIFYFLLAIIVAVSAYIRTRPIQGLKDVTTGTWTLGPDLDPYLFLRWAEYIADHGRLMVVDTMRNVPLGFNTSGEMKLLAYLIAWFHKFLTVFGWTDSVTYSAIIFPVVAFSLTAIAFFMFSRKVFSEESVLVQNCIAIISTALFVLVPSLLPRAIAGIPEKESIAFFFLFLTFYFFISSYKEKSSKKSYIYAVLAGLSTAIMALTWGGTGLAFLTIAAAVLFAFILGKVNKTRLYSYGIWILISFGLPMQFSSRFNIGNLLYSLSSGSVFAIFFLMAIHLYITERLETKEKYKHFFEKIKIPSPFISIIVTAIVFVVIASVYFGIGFVPTQVKEIVGQSVHPLDVSRFGLTVAENKQPFFVNDWKDSFGPSVKGIPLFFWLFIAGSILLFHKMIYSLRKKEKLLLTTSYTIFLLALIFSKYSSNSVLNGESNISLIVYFGGMVFFIGSFLSVYLKRYKRKELSIFQEFNFGYILYFVILTLAIIAARGGIRLILILGAVNPIVVGFLTVKTSEAYFSSKEESKKFLFGLIAIVVIVSLVFTLYIYYNQDVGQARVYIPSDPYHIQWQQAMSWVRTNTPETAVFAHWWDYGYWLQSIGNRATVLDGGNAIVYWDYLMGRYVLTEPDELKRLEFLYTHNATHLLIDSTEIGKYTAFSSIGSDKDYDRFSWISTFRLDEKQTQETRNKTSFVYAGGTSVDEDIVWTQNTTDVFIPRGSILGALLLNTQNETFLQPEGIFINNKNIQYRIPLRYVYHNGKLIDFKTGLEAGIFLYPSVSASSSGQAQVNDKGAALYLSRRTINSPVARLYLFDEKSNYFKLVHSEDDPIVAQLKQSGVNTDFVEYQGFRGPIRIWEIKYPSNIKINEDYLKTDYPPELDVKRAKKGYYN